MQCHDCERDSGRFDFARLCCRVRYMASLSNKGHRQAQLQRWRTKQGDKFADETLEGLKQWHQQNKKS